jgi:hypothetical protein
MKLLRNLILGFSCVWAGAAGAQNVSDTSALGGFRLHRAAGMKALNAEHFDVARDELAAAQALIDDSPSILLLSAQNALGLRDYGAAKGFIADYLRRGFVLDLNRNAEFLKVLDDDLNELLQENQSPLGVVTPVISVSDFVLLDSIAYDAPSDTTFLGALKTGDILKNNGAGAQVLAHFDAGISPQGMGLHDGLLWVATAPSRQNNGYDSTQKTSAIVALDPASGAVVQTVAAPERNLGRMLAGRDALYVVDLGRGEILRLDRYEGALQALIPEGHFDAPQAIVENEDAGKLVVSDFTSGLYVFDLATKILTRIAPPANASLLGITSLSRDGDDLVAVQNGFSPQKVLRLKMRDDWSQVEEATVLLRSQSALKQPAQGVMIGKTLRFVAQSQWEALSKTAPKGQVGPAVVGDVTVE